MTLYRSTRILLAGAALCAAALCVFASPSARAAELVLTLGDGSVPVAEAVASLHAEAREAPGATAVMDQRNTAFVPGVLPIRAGTAVSFPNSDTVRQQLYSFSAPRPFELPLYSGTPPEPIVFDKPGVVVVGCNIHDWMIGHIVVLDTPHFGKSGDDGRVWRRRASACGSVRRRREVEEEKQCPRVCLV